LGRPPREEDEALAVPADRPFVDAFGRNTGRERPRPEADAVVERVCARRGVPRERLGSRSKERQVVRARELVVTLGVERFDVKVRDLAVAMGSRYDSVSLWGRRGAERRRNDEEFSRQLDELDAELCGSDARVQDLGVEGPPGRERPNV
jgi:chromosomal replication initiation ATPase DnaA